jgi:hypothetical protein
MKKNKYLALVAVFSLLSPAFSLAQQTHDHGSSAGSAKMETREVLVEGVKVAFQIMPNDEHRKMLQDMKMKDDIEPNTTHNVTVILTDLATQQPVTDAVVGLKVVDPGGKNQIKSLKYESSMRSFDAYFSMPDKGRYELLVLVKTGDVKRTAGIYYDLR